MNEAGPYDDLPESADNGLHPKVEPKKITIITTKCTIRYDEFTIEAFLIDVSTPTSLWREQTLTEEEARIFVRGVKAGYGMAGCWNVEEKHETMKLNAKEVKEE